MFSYRRIRLYGHRIKIWTPRYYEQFSLSLWTARPHISLRSTRLIRHPVNMDTFYGPLCVRIERGLTVYDVLLCD